MQRDKSVRNGAAVCSVLLLSVKGSPLRTERIRKNEKDREGLRGQSLSPAGVQSGIGGGGSVTLMASETAL